MNKRSETSKKKPAARLREADAPRKRVVDAAASNANSRASEKMGSTHELSSDDQVALLERARMQWQFGDWESVAQINWQTIEQHPQRALLSLLASTAHQQLGDRDSARHHAIHAMQWGCDKRQAARILLAGAHNTLARTAALRHDMDRALRHFRESVDGVGGDAKLACQARSVREAARLNLVDEAARMIREQEHSNGLVAHHGLAGTPRAALFDDHHRPAGSHDHMPGLDPLPDQTGRGQRAIIIAGMRHSGSTAVFNIVRLALEQKGVSFASFYSEGERSDLLNDPEQGMLLVKTHELRDDVIARADKIITTRRDLRDTVASAKRRDFPTLRNLHGAVEYAKYNRALHDQWLPYSSCEFVYEAFMADPIPEVERVFVHLQLGGVDIDAVLQALAALPTDQYQQTLLSPTHATDPQRLLSYHDSLDEVQISKITTDHSAWLQRYGYPITEVDA